LRSHPAPTWLLAKVLVALLLLGAPATARPAEPTSEDDLGAADLLPNEGHPLPGVTTGGPPAEAAGFAVLAAAGYRTYVDLRPATEPGAAAAETYALAAGMSYVRIPVAGEGDLDLASARALDRVLDEARDQPVVVACASGNRAGALLAVEAFWLDGVPAAEALELGRRGGLTRLEPAVRTLLGLAPPAAPSAAPTPQPSTATPPGSR
jgi:uncharacterized protein (TIGR01244 family)